MQLKQHNFIQIMLLFTGRLSDCKVEKTMLDLIAVSLILLWLLGLVSSVTINGFIHILLVVAIIIILVRIIGGRKPF